MDDERKSIYYLDKVDDASALERDIVRIKGVISAKVSSENLTLEYQIDEWTSDYDVFTEVMNIVSSHGCSIDFDRSDAEKEESESQQSEKNDAESVNADEIKAKETSLEEESDEEVKDEKPKKQKISDNKWRVIELSFAVVCFIVSLFLGKHQTVQFIFLAISFAVAGYDALYEAFLKIRKKVIVSDELMISLACFGCVLLGQVAFAVGAMVIYSIVNFVRKIITEKMNNNKVGWGNPENIVVIGEDGAYVKDFEQVEKGEIVSFGKDERIVFDGIVTVESALCKDIHGLEREVKKGEEVFAGEICLSDNIELEITKLNEECKFANYNNFVKKASESSTKLGNFARKKEQIYNIVVLAVCLIIAFVMPVFSEKYIDGLYRWGYTAVIIAAISGLSFYVFASNVNINAVIKAGKKSGAFIAGLDEAIKIAKHKGLYVDDALLYDGENLKEDSHGAVSELKDSDEDVTICFTKSDDECQNICKELSANSYCTRESVQEKFDAVKKAVEEESNCAISSKDYSLLGESEKKDKKQLKKEGAVICLDCEKYGYNGDGVVMHDKIPYLPYIIKLAKRTAKINKATVVLGFLIKAILAVLAILGIADLWWAVLVDSFVSAFVALISFLNGNEVY